MSVANTNSFDFGSRWDQTSAIFLRLMALPAGERAMALDRETDGDPVLRDLVSGLLNSHDGAADIIQQRTPASSTIAVLPNLQRPDIFQTGQIIGDFELIRVLGQGGSATVYLAHELSLSRIIALKVTCNAGTEARTLARLEHDHIVPVFSETIDAERNIRLIAMPFVPGVTLQKLMTELKSRPPVAAGKELLNVVSGRDPVSSSPERETFLKHSPTEFVLAFAIDLVGALEHAHSKGLIHADIKPANILIHPDGRAFLVDFNVARVREDHPDGETNPLGGTFEYMAPEQMDLFFSGQGRQGEHRLTPISDIFSMGMVLREFSLSAGLNEKTHYELFRVFNHCTALAPENRFARASELAQAFEGCLELYRIERAMPEAGIFSKAAQSHPLLMLTVGGFFIQFVASLVSIAYNEANVVTHLSTSQQSFFVKLLLIYNPICFVIGMSLWLLGMKRLQRFLQSPAEFTELQIRNLRQDVRRIPNWVFWLSFGSWMPGAIFFPLTIHLGSAPLPPSAFLHFAGSFTLSFSIAISYGMLYAEYLSLRYLYARFWDPREKIRDTARVELVRSLPRLRLCQLLVGWAPVVGALIIVGVGPNSWLSSQSS